VIDLHIHILPGLDDGPATMDGAVELARRASELGTETVVATPHLRDDHPYPIDAIAERVMDLQARLRAADVPLAVYPGAEVAIAKAFELEDSDLAKACLGTGPYLLVESPYTYVADLVENVLFELQVRGFRPILAHPERSPSFLDDRARLAAIVERGVLCSVTAQSMAGRFGGTVQRFTAELLAAGLVHNVASDAHDQIGRSPELQHGFRVLDRHLPGLVEQADWFTHQVPEAIIAGEPIYGRPPALTPRRSRWRRALRRLRPGSSERNPAGTLTTTSRRADTNSDELSARGDPHPLGGRSPSGFPDATARVSAIPTQAPTSPPPGRLRGRPGQ
jgi:protein-tyrosine phosphatase